MHSSRMRTVRSSGRISGGCTWSRGGVPGPGGVPGLGGTCPGGVYQLGGVHLVWGGVPGQVLPLPVDRHMSVKT